MIRLIRTDSTNKDFISLAKKLDIYLAETDGNDHEFYAQFNIVDKINNVVIAFLNEQAVGCGAIKKFNETTVEIKRMYTATNARNKGVATAVLKELEVWAKELEYKKVVLETGVKMPSAVNFYKSNSYLQIENYGQYQGIETSICFKKNLY